MMASRSATLKFLTTTKTARTITTTTTITSWANISVKLHSQLSFGVASEKLGLKFNIIQVLQQKNFNWKSLIQKMLSFWFK